MGDQRTTKPDASCDPDDALERYRVFYRTRLPELRARSARVRANLRWIAEGGYKVPGAKPPFEDV